MRRTPWLLLLPCLFACPNNDQTPDAGPMCTSASDCSAPMSACETVTCQDGACARALLPADASVGLQTPGDCLRNACDGQGHVVSLNDDSDVISDGKECTADSCSQGASVHAPLDAGVACGTNGALSCDGAGHCIGCKVAADCPGGDECRAASCNAGLCGFIANPRGMAVATQVAGDCRRAQCDGTGNKETVPDDSDVPNDSESCTTDGCANGAPTFTPLQSGSPCHEDGGSLCDGSGACKQCLVGTDCPGNDGTCFARACVAGVCGTRAFDAGVPLISQTSGDCRRGVCAGDGGVTTVADNADLPNDNNPCTANACSNGAPSFPALDAGVGCGTSLLCDGSGLCVGCIAASDCGADDVCRARTCTSGTCGLLLADAGTVVASQQAGDCRANVCDSQGNVVGVNDDLDVPADDGNACTSETCVSGVPSHPNVGTNTPCGADAGFVCTPAGACVECNAGTQCPGLDTDCRSRSCVSNQCGFANAAAMSVAPTQTGGDCLQRRCDGDGGVLFVAFDSDVPADDGEQCTADVCDAGVPQHPPRDVDVPCTELGGHYCNGLSACVECTHGAQCSSKVCATNATCAAATCNDGVLNGSETDVDCGGSCPTCDVNKMCMQNADCTNLTCSGGICALVCTDASAFGEKCSDYCACMVSTCPTKVTDLASCLTACAAFAEAQLCCRGYHCTAAMSDAVTHCPHAAGEAVCP